MTPKPKWTDRLYGPIRVLNHADELNLEKFTEADLDQIADCDDVFEINLRSNRTAEPLDLSRLAHITALRDVTLERMKFTNLEALQTLPNLCSLTIDDCQFTDFAGLNGLRVKTLFLRNNKLTHFPAGLDLPQLQCLVLSHNRIADLAFAASYPLLEDLSVNGNRITDVSPLAGCANLAKLSVDNNPLTTLVPLTGCRFRRLHTSNELHAEKVALHLELPEQPYVQDADSAEAWRIVRLMEAKDWPQVYAIASPELLGMAFSSLVHGGADAEMMRGALAHPAPGAFEAMVAQGLDARSTRVLEQLVDVLSEQGERLLAPLSKAFQDVLARTYWYDGGFSVGKFKQEHFTIARVLQKVASPVFAGLFLAFFEQRVNFSQLHLNLYKWLLDVVGQTQSPALVLPLIDLLHFEKHILGGDAVFMKKIFKAIGQLGSKADASVLASRFDVSAETRADVAEAYEATLKKLAKKKS